MLSASAKKQIQSWLRQPAVGILSAATTLMLSSGCGFSPARDQVFAPPSPHELESRLHPETRAVQAEYPGTVYPDSQTSEGTRTEAQYPADGQFHMSQLRAQPPISPNPFEAAEYQLTQLPADESAGTVSFSNYGSIETSSGILKTSFTQAAPRTLLGCPTNQMETVAASPLADMFPDEYLFDGGDRGYPVHTKVGELQGLETEDTIAEFVDHTGVQKRKPSNRVAVYAPRFGSIRTVAGLESGVKVDKAAGAKESRGTGNLKSGQKAAASVKEDAIVGVETRHKPDGVDTSVPPSASIGTDRPQENRKADSGQQGVGTFIPNTMQHQQIFEIAQGRQNAIAWSRNEFPLMKGSTTAGQDVTSQIRVQAVIGIEDERETKGDLRIVKLADRGTAQIGDIVTFTIQFENVGDFDVYDVRIVDNLTPRLNYVTDSASHDPDHPGEITIEPNGEGSQILTFTLEKPLKGHTKGTITFEAVVR
ncbi:MAG: DUF11 domain-containing protein [Planctomyces sp.]|nr:DUF11 domain-containing protein [Planctomyces sp.]